MTIIRSLNFKFCFILVGAFFNSHLAHAEVDLNSVAWDAYVEAQYAFDFNAPAARDRAYTTQPARHNEFNINLAHIGASLQRDKLRARISLQTGTSVQSNYLAEPTTGAVSGGDLSRHIQEARIGYKIGESTWIDAGIFFSHIGSEAWISRDNIVLTRSLVADFSPYYLSGAKLTHSFNERLTVQLLVVNGWQNISENNNEKSIGTGIEYATDSFSIAYNAMAGREVSSPLLGVVRSGEFRHFHDLIVRSKGLDKWEWVAQFDIGSQERESASGSDTWYGTTLLTRYTLNEHNKISARLEHYRDDDQVIIVTGVPDPINAIGGSIGFDRTLEQNVLWRTELRYLHADADIFPEGVSGIKNENYTATTSLALSF